MKIYKTLKVVKMLYNLLILLTNFVITLQNKELFKKNKTKKPSI